MEFFMPRDVLIKLQKRPASWETSITSPKHLWGQRGGKKGESFKCITQSVNVDWAASHVSHSIWLENKSRGQKQELKPKVERLPDYTWSQSPVCLISVNRCEKQLCSNLEVHCYGCYAMCWWCKSGPSSSLCILADHKLTSVHTKVCLRSGMPLLRQS